MLTLFALCLTLTRPESLTVNVRTNVENAVVQAVPGRGDILAAQVARLLRWRGDLNRQVHRGDQLTVLYEPSPTQPTLLAMQYQGSQLQLSAYAYAGKDGLTRYYDETGKLIEPKMLNPPVPNYEQITETVQHGRGKRKHAGIDLKAAEGTPIIMPFTGTIARLNWMTRVNGNCIEVLFDDGRIGRFLHLAAMNKSLHAGMRVSAGTHLGTVGSTGMSNGPHLHYELRDTQGNPVEPLNVHGKTAAALERESLPAFFSQRDFCKKQMLIHLTKS